MPKILSRALTEPRCRAIKPVPGKTLKLVDGDGLQLLVRPTGRKVWELRLQHAGRERTATLGTYPDLTLAAARSAAAAERVEARLTPRDAFVPSLSFEDAFEDWMKVKEVGLKNGYAQDIRERLTFNALPDLRTKPLRAISRQDVIAVLKKIADRGAHVQARRVRALLAEMFEWAAINELMGDNPA
ncbi:MAG: Arm DNA-binding domain-containing protein, partial [Burkholderiaceae bacterium]